MKKYDKVLYEALIEEKLLPKDGLDNLVKEMDTSGQGLQGLLVKKGVFAEKDILNILARKLRLKYLDARGVAVESSVIQKVPVKIATYYRFLPLNIKGRTLTVAASSPLDIKTQDEIRTQLGYEVEVVLSQSADILSGLERYYGLAAETLEGIVSQKVAETEKGPTQLPQERVEDIEKLAEDASVIKLVNQIILEGWRKRATDIHIEPYRDKVALRYRIDGLLYDASIPPAIKGFLNAIISRVKIMSNLNIVERRIPQDGRAIVRVQNQVLDLRISTVPTPFGESVVIRILPTERLLSLETLGLSKKNLKLLEGLIQKPHGIIFVSGPTGSGKTTTLYACLNRINTKERKIITIEDPIEYEMSGIIQTQVMPEIQLDFARCLRSILRHDPDVIMVGEVRDLETAEIAIRVALTGHLIFSTLHTNDAASGVTRLVDIGVEPYLVASSAEAFIAQRLIRVICPSCKYEDKAAPQELKNLIAKDLGLHARKVKIYKGKGCPNCNFTGFFGRTAIYEVLFLDEEIRDLLLKKSPSGEIKKMAISKGMQTLRQDGWQKVMTGETTPEEVMKVTPAGEYEGAIKKAAASPTPGALIEIGNQAFPLDKRTYPRLKTEVSLSYKIFGSEEELLGMGYKPEQISTTRDISAGGLLFAVDVFLPVGTILELTIELPDEEEPLKCLARVVRTVIGKSGAGYDTGVCFLDITSANKAKLNQYIESESKK